MILGTTARDQFQNTTVTSGLRLVTRRQTASVQRTDASHREKDPNIHFTRCSRCIYCISDQVMSDHKNDEWQIGKDLQRSGRGVIEAPSRNLPGINEENHVKHQDCRCFDRYYIRHPSECAHLDTFDQTNTCATAWNQKLIPCSSRQHSAHWHCLNNAGSSVVIVPNTKFSSSTRNSAVSCPITSVTFVTL